MAQTIIRLPCSPRLSDATVHQGVVYLAGQIADDASQDMFGQTQQVLACIDSVLAMAGSDKTKLLSCTVYIADMALFAEMNRAWDAWIDPAHLPARATVQAQLANPALLVEIQAIAAV
jgi:enamine deaminase RidA (YjgF/YER057c/UK114 family)